jgi:hypothetical protein
VRLEDHAQDLADTFECLGAFPYVEREPAITIGHAQVDDSLGNQAGIGSFCRFEIDDELVVLSLCHVGEAEFCGDPGHMKASLFIFDQVSLTLLATAWPNNTELDQAG